MSDLAAFLAARLDEIESNARQALAQWADTHFTIDPGSLVIVGFHRTHDPARVLREVAAKRAILALHEVHSESTRWGSSHSDPAMRGQPTGGTTYWCEICDYDRDFGHIGSHQEGCGTLRTLAAVYSDHPGYQQEWKAVG